MTDSSSLPNHVQSIDPLTDELIERCVHEETTRARTKHSFSMERATNERSLRILVEEIGEVAEAMEDLDLAENAVPCDPGALEAADQHLLEEIIQVASAAQRWARVVMMRMAAAAVDPIIIETKRFFTFSLYGGATYWIVARDASHAVSVLDGVEFGDPSVPFSEAHDEDGDKLAMTEVTATAAEKVNVIRDDRDAMSTPLTHCDIGHFYSNEY